LAKLFNLKASLVAYQRIQAANSVDKSGTRY
jgi:hypothetical protein